MKKPTQILVISLAAFGLPLGSMAFAESGAPSQAEITNALRPVPPALQGGHQGLPMGGSAPVVEPRRTVTRASTGGAATSEPPVRERPFAAAAPNSPALQGCPERDTISAKMSLPTITFVFGSAQLKPEAIATLQQLGKSLTQDYPDTNVFVIEGHTDAAGTFDYNRELSLQRAQAVKDYLTQQTGVKPERLQVAGVGYCDLAKPSDPRGAENRRVVVVNKAS